MDDYKSNIDSEVIRLKFKSLIIAILLYLLFCLWYFNSIWFNAFGFAHWSLKLATFIFFFVSIKFALGLKTARYFAIAIVLIAFASIAIPSICQIKHPVPALFGIAKIEMKLAEIVKISNSPPKYIVSEGTFGKLDHGIEITHSDRSEWDNDFIIDGIRYRSDWVIYLGRYKIYTLQTTPMNSH